MGSIHTVMQRMAMENLKRLVARLMFLSSFSYERLLILTFQHTDGQQHRQQYEMSNLPSQTSAQAPPQGQQPSAYQQPLPRNDFFKEVQFIRDELKDLAAKVTQIKSLHSRLLDAADSSSSSELGSTLTGLETNLLAKNDQIRRRIRTLEQDAANCTDDSKEQRSQQANSMKREFQSKLEDYMYAEKQYRDDRRVQIRRQYMIVNPEATDQELKAVADELPGSESEGIFQRAVSIPSKS
jgi:syntaxin 1B/2/3